MVALTVSSCLGVAVSAEDPRYQWLGDLLDVTAPQIAAQHPGLHLYAAKPGKVRLVFAVTPSGQPADLTGLLQDAVYQVNQQQPWRFRLQRDVRLDHTFFSFVPTASHNESGQMRDEQPWMDDRISIPAQTAPIMEIANAMADRLTSEFGYDFYCCQSLVFGHMWGDQPAHYEASNELARHVMQDLMVEASGPTSYVLRCQPMDKRFCFINVVSTVKRIPAAAPESGVCTALGYEPN